MCFSLASCPVTSSPVFSWFVGHFSWASWVCITCSANVLYSQSASPDLPGFQPSLFPVPLCSEVVTIGFFLTSLQLSPIGFYIHCYFSCAILPLTWVRCPIAFHLDYWNICLLFLLSVVLLTTKFILSGLAFFSKIYLWNSQADLPYIVCVWERERDFIKLAPSPLNCFVSLLNSWIQTNPGLRKIISRHPFRAVSLHLEGFSHLPPSLVKSFHSLKSISSTMSHET